MSQTSAQLISSGIVAPATLSTGAPGWDSSGNLSFNSGYGSSTVAYGCRAWVNFNGSTATPSTIRGSGNVSSVTKNGSGDYTVNFTTALADANYAITGAAGQNTTSLRVVCPNYNLAAPTTSAVRIQVPLGDGATLADSTLVCIAVFR